MPTNFPTSLDALTNPTSGDQMNSVTVPHAEQHTNVNDAIEAIEAKVGIDNSAVTTSLDYITKSASSLNPGHVHSKLRNSGNTGDALTIDASGNVSIFTGNLRVGSGTANAAIDSGVGSIVGGTNSASSGLRTSLDLSANASNAQTNFLFGGSGLLLFNKSNVFGTNDIFNQAIPPTTAGYYVVECWNGAGLILGTGNNSNPISLRINRTEVASLTASGLDLSSVVGSVSYNPQLRLTTNQITEGSATWDHGWNRDSGSNDSYLALIGTSSSLAVFNMAVTGDTFRRLRMQADGKMEWGPGSSTRDTNLYRDSTDHLRTDDSFIALSYKGGSNYATASRRVILDLAGYSFQAGATFTFPNGGVFGVDEADVIGTNDIFFQGLSASAGGWTALEAWGGAGISIGTGNSSTNPITFRLNRNEVARFGASGFGLGITSPTAKLHLAAGSSSANTAPIKMTAGTVMSTAEAGTIEYNNNFYATKTGPVRFTVGGCLFNNFSDAGNGTTVETDLYSNTIAANTLATNGDKLEADYGLVIVNSSSSKQIKVYFAGTAIFDSGALTTSSTASMAVRVLIIRDSSTTIRYLVGGTAVGISTTSFAKVGKLTGLTLSNTNILKITGQAIDPGAATNDIVAYLGNVNFIPAI